MYKLHFPNCEVRQGMIDGLTNYLMDTDDIERDAAVLAMACALKCGDLSASLLQRSTQYCPLDGDGCGW